MSDEVTIPASYNQWRHFIEVTCRIKLTKSFLDDRLAELQNGDHSKTKEFARLYGADHLERTVSWFRWQPGET
ncbi:MAG: hypothetical protein AAGG44_07430, partial [Planctomycetota bacterium]